MTTEQILVLICKILSSIPRRDGGKYYECMKKEKKKERLFADHVSPIPVST